MKIIDYCYLCMYLNQYEDQTYAIITESKACISHLPLYLFCNGLCTTGHRQA